LLSFILLLSIAQSQIIHKTCLLLQFYLPGFCIIMRLCSEKNVHINHIIRVIDYIRSESSKGFPAPLSFVRFSDHFRKANILLDRSKELRSKSSKEQGNLLFHNFLSRVYDHSAFAKEPPRNLWLASHTALIDPFFIPFKLWTATSVID
jgi:hypothetical protein